MFVIAMSGSEEAIRKFLKEKRITAHLTMLAMTPFCHYEEQSDAVIRNIKKEKRIATPIKSARNDNAIDVTKCLSLR